MNLIYKMKSIDRNYPKEFYFFLLSILSLLFSGDTNSDVIWFRLGVWIAEDDGEYNCGVIEREEIDSSLVNIDEIDDDDDDDS